jgi:hypothetical protein
MPRPVRQATHLRGQRQLQEALLKRQPIRASEPSAVRSLDRWLKTRPIPGFITLNNGEESHRKFVDNHGISHNDSVAELSLW